jgi:glycosyltransferase involved in cell wall biosynthesis
VYSMIEVTVVVPTRNSAATLGACLKSVREQSHRCSLVVVDNHSTDGTAEIAQGLADLVIVAGPERSVQRNRGAAEIPADVFGFVDSDMVLEPEVVAQAAEVVSAGAGAVVVPEYTVGTGYWARVREFERSFYTENPGVEAARFFSRHVFEEVGGYDPDLTSSEDWDITIRARGLAPVGRTSARVAHHEGRVKYLAACARKGRYAGGLRLFARKHGVRGLGSVADRSYLRRPWQLIASHPELGAGVIALKSGEAIAVGAALAWSMLRGR